MNLQDIQLTEQDFDLLIDGLNELPNSGAAGFMLASLVGGMMTAGDPRAEAAVNKHLEKEGAQREAKKKERSEEITLLKSKLILLKRYLVTNGALKTTNKILGNE